MDVLTRREMLQAGVLAGAALAVPRARAATGAASAGPVPPPFSVPLSVPPVARPVRRSATTDYYVLAIRPAAGEVLPGRRTALWTYGGQFPGPTIHARRGRAVVVRVRNELRQPHNVHLHGARVAAADDGFPTDVIAPGASRVYHYPNLQAAGTLWYHDHVHGFTSRNVYRGLAGLYLLHDPAEARLRLPAGPFDVPLVIQDRSFAPDGSLAFHRDHFSVLGDTVLVNGRPQPFLRVLARRYRLRLVNGSNSRAYRLRLSSGRALVQVGADAGLLAAPHARSEIELWPSERADVVVDFAGHAAGSSIVLENTAAPGGATQVMRFDVAGGAPDPSAVPRRLRAIAPPARAAQTREVVLSLDAASGQWVINGRRFDHERVDARVRRGVPEVWRLVNRSAVTHPIHFHNQSFRVLDRDGRPPPPWEAGFKDTVAVEPREAVRILLRFERYLGRYVYHCHSLPHEDHDMMATVEVVP